MPLQTHTLFILWSEFTKQFLKNIFREFRDKALMATIFLFFFFFRESTKHKFTQLTILLVKYPHVRGGIPEFNSLHLYQFAELSEFHDPSSDKHIHVCVYTHTLPQSKAG